MVYGLIIANVAVYMLWQVADGNFMRDNFMVSQILNYMLLDDAYLDFVCHTLAWSGMFVSELVGARNKYQGFPSIVLLAKHR